MLLLFETAAGFALFKVLDDKKLSKVDDLWTDFATLDAAKKVVKLKAFSKFENTTEALAAATSVVDSKLSKGLKKFLKKNATGDSLAVLDAKLGNIVKDKLGIQCVHSNAVLELARGIRAQLEGLISGLAGSNLTPMCLGLSHSLSRYKLKFSPDKVDTMIVQAIGLLDDLDKELNTYAMRVREWYGWHFPEMTKIVADNIQYAKVIKHMGLRERAASLDFSGILEEDVEAALKAAAVISMGTDISQVDLDNITDLCDQVIELSTYRAHLFDYLKSRMTAIAPNLTILVGELVGARLISHAGSLINLAKQPASTVQILGAEKALFRALKTKHETPKYGLIYHASLIGQSSAKFKGKISRVLAAKCALAIRVDALGDTSDASIGIESRAKVEARMRQLEGRMVTGAVGVVRAKDGPAKYDSGRQGAVPHITTAPAAYNTDADVTADAGKASFKKKDKKRKPEDEEEEEAPAPAAQEGKKKKKKKAEDGEADGVEEKKKKKKKKSEEEAEEPTNGMEKEKKKKKKDK